MSRKLYESKEDLNRESACINHCVSKWGTDFKKLPISYRLDFMVTSSGQAAGWVEIKCRTHKSNQYDTVMLSLSKWNAGIDLHEKSGLPFIFVVSFKDAVFRYLYSVEDSSINIRWGGRTRATRDIADIEPVVHIPINLFKNLGAINEQTRVNERV